MSVEAMSWAKEQKTGSPGAKLVLLILADYANEDGVSWPSKQSIVRITEQSQRTVTRQLRQLEELGILCTKPRQRGNGSSSSNIYELALEGVSECHGGGVTRAQGGGHGVTPRGVTRAPPEPPVRTTSEPPEETELFLQMHRLVCRTFHHKRWKPLKNRMQRYRAVALESDPEGHEFLQVWQVLLNAVWSDPWRRQAHSHHDPVNILRSPEQREAWWEVALMELEAGRDGSTYHHRSGESEESVLARKRAAVRARQTRACLQELEDSEAEAHQKAREASEFVETLAEEDRTRFKDILEKTIRAIWPLTRPVPANLKRAALVQTYRQFTEERS